ncbi:MAG: sulfatase [Akkermansiaceae bacterium]|nr:sulfatase [Akkermansiaceae bacterium]
MIRRTFILPLLAAVPCLTAAARPNILFILADDLGYADVNSFASHLTGDDPADMFYETPNIDRLTKDGTAFSQAYVCPLCSPTRASVLTGINAARLGFTTATPHVVRSYASTGTTPPAGYLPHDAMFWGDDIDTPQALLNGSTLLALPTGRKDDGGRDVTTFAEALDGYRRAFLGKWHLGGHGADGHQPSDQGFKELAWFDSGASPFFRWRGLWNRSANTNPAVMKGRHTWGNAGEPGGSDYLTDDLTDRADRFIRNHHEKSPDTPFLLYLCHFAVHEPLEAKPDDIRHFETKPAKGRNGHDNATYAAMIRSLDQSVGRLMATLDDLQIASNTLVVFLSDNGGVSWTTMKGKKPVTSNKPLKGGKAMMYEGGIRVPLVVRWPAKVRAGVWCDEPVHCTDLFPTFVEASGGNPEETIQRLGLDGQSIMPLLDKDGNASVFHREQPFFWHYPFNVAPLDPDDKLPLTPHSAIRKGDMKLIYDWHGGLRLYNIAKDPFETHDLADEKPDLAKSLFRELNDWIDAKVDVKYTPALNPDYDPAAEIRKLPFTDLRGKLLGPDRTIRAAAGDPRLAP